MNVAWQQIEITQSSEGQVMAKFAVPDRKKTSGAVSQQNTSE